MIVNLPNPYLGESDQVCDNKSENTMGLHRLHLVSGVELDLFKGLLNHSKNSDLLDLRILDSWTYIALD